MICTWQGAACPNAAVYLVLSGCLNGHVRQRMLCKHHMEVHTQGATICNICNDNSDVLEHHYETIPAGFEPAGKYD